MTIPSSHSPKGEEGRCPACSGLEHIEPSALPTQDAPCPHCGAPTSFPGQSTAAVDALFRDSRELSEIVPPSPRHQEPPARLELQELTDPRELEEAERLYERLQ